MNKKELIWRWENHKKILEELKKSNIDKKLIEKWKKQIDIYFQDELRSSL